ncbi:MAG: hypothetical protein K8S00_06470 [Bacteroidales bacterium]|nr:hypothetical protein [Bacteroidales bacterium]
MTKKITTYFVFLCLSGLISVAIGQNDTIKSLLLYESYPNARIDGATVYLKDASFNIIATTTTDTGMNVNCSFPGLSAGTYYVGVSYINKPWGYSNSTDAMMIQQHFVGIITLTGLPLIAADVWYQIGVINTDDAWAVMRRFTHSIPNFLPWRPDDWVVNIDYQVVITSGNEFLPIYTRCYGDVN